MRDWHRSNRFRGGGHFFGLCVVAWFVILFPVPKLHERPSVELDAARHSARDVGSGIRSSLTRAGQTSLLRPKA